MEQKSALAIHDISCVGRCSLTVALPILSAMGINTGVLPTAILSTHTGGFDNFTYRNLTSDIHNIENHFNSLDLSFDALYSGFLGSVDQIEKVASVFNSCSKEDSVILVDPVMGDHGKLYSVYDESMIEHMKKLCSKATIITPNLTEAAFLVGEKYEEFEHTIEYIHTILEKLSAMGSFKIVLTGISFNQNEIGACVYEEGHIEYIHTQKINRVYPGTGDIFSSVLLGGILNDFSLIKSVKLAVDYTYESIKNTTKGDLRYGVSFEKTIPFLIQEVYKKTTIHNDL